jgi:signal transduction histidine kinase
MGQNAAMVCAPSNRAAEFKPAFDACTSTATGGEKLLYDLGNFYRAPMTASSPSPSDCPSDRLAGARSADLAELLGHVTTSWDDQRRLLARQLHDSLGSSMTALTMHLALLTQQLPQEKALLERSAQMKQLLAAIIDNNREMQLALWNDKLEFLGIGAAISELVADFRATHKLTARSSLPEEDVSCPRLQAVALLRCLEEGLSNVALHANATELDVILDDDGDQVTLTVRDNGVGIGPEALANAAAAGGAGAGAGAGLHHGLRVLRERAAYLGGSFCVGPPHEGQGTVLTLTLPRDKVNAA